MCERERKRVIERERVVCERVRKIEREFVCGGMEKERMGITCVR